MGTTPSSGDLKGLRALVVEDTWHVGKALQKLLEDLGVEVAGPVATVTEAERLIAECAFAVLPERVEKIASVLPKLGVPSDGDQPKPYTAAKVLATLRQRAF
jgi:hypothetical protein